MVILVLLIAIAIVVIEVVIRNSIGTAAARRSQQRRVAATQQRRVQQPSFDPPLPDEAASIIVDKSMRVVAFERDGIKRSPRRSTISRISDSLILAELRMLQKSDVYASKMPTLVFNVAFGSFTLHLLPIGKMDEKTAKVTVELNKKHLYFLLAEDDGTFLLLSPTAQQKLIPIIESPTAETQTP
ncbi:MAG TPA: hypothetical protein GX734_05145 [Clostridiaceae bacterium]|nr:hypothetical protein [Clostridiaceae bacterium]